MWFKFEIFTKIDQPGTVRKGDSEAEKESPVAAKKFQEENLQNTKRYDQ